MFKTDLTVAQRLDISNPSVDEVAQKIYDGIDEILGQLAKIGVFVDNGIAVMPYETFTEAEMEEVHAWEVKFIKKAAAVAYFRWAQEQSNLFDI